MTYDASVDGPDIATWRAARGMSQADLARALGINTQTVWRWEVGRRSPPAGNVLDRALRDLDRELRGEVGPTGEEALS